MIRSKNLLSISLLIAILAGTAGAQELEFSGSVKAAGVYYPSEPALIPVLGFSGAALKLDLAEAGLLVLGPEAWLSLQNRVSTEATASTLYPLGWRFAAPVGDQATLDIDLDIKEFYYENSFGDLDLRVGKQIFAWGLADGTNPTDLLNARHVGTRLAANTNENKLGALALDLVWNLADGKSRIEGVFLPFSVVNDLPAIPTVSGPPAVSFVNARPDWAVENFEGAIRGLFYLDNFSFSVSYLTILDRFPDLAEPVITLPAFPPFIPTTIENTFIYPRTHNVGLDWATSIEGFDFRGEWLLALMTDTDGSDYLVKNSSVNGTVQLSRSWLDGNLITGLTWAPRYVLQHKAWDSYTTETERERVFLAYSRNGQGFPVENTLGLRVEAKLIPEVLSTTLFGLYNLAAQDYLAQLSVDWNLADGLKLKTSGTLYGSTRASDDDLRAFGVFGNTSTDAKDNVSVELVYSF